MDVLESAKLSVYKKLADGLAAGTINGALYHVYNEDDLRAATVPVEPHIYILDYGVFYEFKHLPVILIQTEMEAVGFELGSNDTYLCNVALHIVGANRGQRDGLMSAIMRKVKTFDIYNYMVTPPVLAVGGLGLEEDARGREWSIVDTAVVPVDLLSEGTLANWQPISTAFLLVNPSSWPTS